MTAAPGPDPGVLLVGLVRAWSRPSGDPMDADLARTVNTLEAVAALGARGTPASVTSVAQELGVSLSHASRLLRRATASGLVAAAEADDDARCRHATLTPPGWRLLEQARRRQSALLARLTADWEADRRTGFEQALRDLSAQYDDLGRPTLAQGQHRAEPNGVGRAGLEPATQGL